MLVDFLNIHPYAAGAIIFIMAALVYAIGYNCAKNRVKERFRERSAPVERIYSPAPAPRETRVSLPVKYVQVPVHIPKDTSKMLFFPQDPKVLPCHATFHFLLGERAQDCSARNCPYSHGRPGELHSSHLMEIFRSLSRAQRKIDICMYNFAHEYLAKLLIFLHRKRGVQIRIVTNHKCDDPSNDKIPSLHAAGISVKQNKSEERTLMHNKFAIIDTKTVVWGSANWGYCAFTRNYEVVNINQDSGKVLEFARQFEDIWMNKSCQYRVR